MENDNKWKNELEDNELVEARPDARLQLSVIVNGLIRLNDSQWYPSSIR